MSPSSIKFARKTIRPIYDNGELTMLENKKIRTVLLLVGLALFITGAFAAWTFRPPADESGAEYGTHDELFYFVSKMASLAGFIIALGPSTVAIGYELEEMKRTSQTNEDAAKSATDDPEYNSEKP